jgi:hypothetical protein
MFEHTEEKLRAETTSEPCSVMKLRLGAIESICFPEKFLVAVYRTGVIYCNHTNLIHFFILITSFSHKLSA